MSIDNYIAEVETLIASYSIVSSYILTIDRKTSDIAFISGTIEFKNGFTLDFKEFVEHKGQVVEKYSYGYNYRYGADVLFRYDNAPDPRARNLTSFPHHKHLRSGGIAESHLIRLTNVFEEIESIAGRKED
ncbi:MAG: hypothetical protein CO150_01510 [Nitrospirae bacterium CG_4_9_14_3_um_filter_53_35]|nr:MAG: hypothetical protein COT35_04645 [Nitrospirae bacterium CG08_land_8_20_14_0_20_52_24]PIV85044.1 MAG: hypothetical protein COW52_04375 [Nitrospirae bacterium CG17_big_fil_post_rev_8_21_14_2_50_50_9]PIW86270.1 MAG: hypothetical protein COZ95_00170 [Nitrospirae bacterium CG_4_8_14_3_um_filter_50_41]PIX85855.1 MAG: hypothetical protein COZ32_06340 [Nitrospirae bacterium CG_4_10_14_3_um_filter_53_41]PJA77323.1 MAG: hypothetical protein CO150_01510 [Nitrospirae bacterium CG_4_9_14_3_um_filter